MKINKRISGESENASAERVTAFSDGIFAIVITIMILELKRPAHPSFEALFEEWPTWISYIVSYVFIAIVWINHHYLLRHARVATMRLIWANFAHLFAVSLIPFNTDWVAETRLAPVPVVLYAFVFLLVNLTYLLLIWETVGRKESAGVPRSSRRLFRMRSVFTLFIFGSAMITAFWHPYAGFGLICACLVFYLWPEVKG